MSPQLKQLLLPQSSAMDDALEGCDLSYVYYTTDSSSSDIASPLTPTFSHRGGVPLRYSSSTSSLELPVLPLEGPASPIAQHAAASKSSIRQLPDVQEEPLEREQEYDEEYDDDDDNLSDTFGMYCLCDQACEHQEASRELLRNEITGEYDIDYDIGFLSDSDFSGDAHFSRKKRHISGDALAALSSRIGSRFPSIARWTSQRKANSIITGLMASPTTERSLENVLSGVESSRSSSMSSPALQFPVLLDDASPMMPPPMSFYESTDSLERSGIERDRAMATTPLLPPLMTDPLGKPPLPSSSAVTEVPSPRALPTPRQSIGSKPSMSSLRQPSSSVLAELPLPLSLPPSILLDQDEWSDRLGHANFTISPAPYAIGEINAVTVNRFCDDWDAARSAYTKHLVRTGEHYGQTSNIYALTEAKWAETERRWKAFYADIARQMQVNVDRSSSMLSRSRSRGRGRGRRSESANPAGHSRTRQDNEDLLVAMQWRGRKGCLPSAVPQMLEALDADGKFPLRGDEDIVGPMHRVPYMKRARSEEKTPRFWKNLAEKLRL
ncbi:hypothetical protein ACQKWADRAFT_327628 [Trichoderma austrokoningii]